MKTLTSLSASLQYEFTKMPVPHTSVDLSKMALPPNLSHLSLSMRSNSKYILPGTEASYRTIDLVI